MFINPADYRGDCQNNGSADLQKGSDLLIKYHTEKLQ